LIFENDHDLFYNNNPPVIFENTLFKVINFIDENKNSCRPELKTLEWDILNLEIKKKRKSGINLDIHHSKVFGSDQTRV